MLRWVSEIEAIPWASMGKRIGTPWDRSSSIEVEAMKAEKYKHKDLKKHKEEEWWTIKCCEETKSKTEGTEDEKSILIYKDYREVAKNGKEGTCPRKRETLTFKRWQYKESTRKEWVSMRGK
jgi:hypothetical protein